MYARRKNLILAFAIMIFFVLLVMVQRQAQGAELDPGVGTSHSVLGTLGLDPRAAALGWSVTAVDMGVGGLEYNPASTARLDGRSFYLGHLTWVLDAHLSQAQLAFPFLDEGVIGLGITHFDQGTIDEVLADGTFTGERLGARDFQFSAGLARPLGKYLDVGLKLSVFHKTLGRESAGGVMGSVGILTQEMDGFRFGAAIQDAGPQLRFRENLDPAPVRYRTGLSHTVRIAQKFRWQNSIDYMAPRDNYASFGIGTEWDYRDVLILRAGYRRTLEEDETPDGDRFHYGCGLRVGNYRFDYAFGPKEDFDGVHHMAVTFEFRGERRTQEDRELKEAIARDVLTRAAAYDSLQSAEPDSTPPPEPGPPPLPKVTILRGINFEVGDDEIGEGSDAILDEIFARLLNTPGIEGVEIQGHSDNTGDETFNQDLSLSRARSVRDYFVSMGYPQRKIGVMGFGSTRPMAANDTAAGRAANRRIEIHVIRRGDAD